MGTELEAKFRVASHEPFREKLKALGAAPAEFGLTEETNTFFDTPAGALKSQDKGIRIRRNRRAAGESLVVTYKGPKMAGPFKQREEIEVEVDDHDAFATILSRLGYDIRLSFQKRRETWHLAGCTVELDTLPQSLGTFLEVEAPEETSLRAVLTQLELENAPQEPQSYSAIIAGYIAANALKNPIVNFA